MRSYPSCWNKTLTKLGFKRVFKRHLSRRGKPKKLQLGRRSLIEQLEPRQMLAADTYVVSTLEDVAIAGTSTDDQWSLREALVHSASDATHQAGERDTIKFAPLLWSGTVELDAALGHLVVDSDVTIEGPGADLLTIDAQGDSRSFYTMAGNEITIEGLTITGGGNVTLGGAIYNKSDLTINRVDFVGNEVLYEASAANNHGGAVYSRESSLTILNSTFEGNQAHAGGGLAIYLPSGEQLIIENTLFTENLGLNGAILEGTPEPNVVYANSGNGGGIYLSASGGSTVTILDTTFSENHARFGGGLYLNGASASVEITNATFTENTANLNQGGGGGIYSQSYNAMALYNSIVAHNTAYHNATRDVYRTLNSNSASNLFGATYYSGITNGQQGNVVLNAGETAGLLPLGDYGGPVQTHGLKLDSKARDTGDNLYASTNYTIQPNQLLDRIVNGTVDRGAQEYGAKPILVGKLFAIDTDDSVTSQSDSRVTTNELGQSAVVWRGTGEEGTGFYVQLFNPDGAATSQARRVDVGYGTTKYDSARVAIDRSGRLAVSWSENVGGIQNIYLRRYAANGTPVDTLPVQVSVASASANISPSIVSNSAGQLLVTWQSSNKDLFFRRFTTGGLTLDNSPRLAQISEVVDANNPQNDRSNLQTGSSGRYAAVADNGSFFLFWSQSTTTGEYGFIQKFSSSGNRTGAELQFEAIEPDPSAVNEVSGTLSTPEFQSTYNLTDDELTPYDIAIGQDDTVIVAWQRKATWWRSTGGIERTEQTLRLRTLTTKSEWSDAIEIDHASGLVAWANGQDISYDMNFTFDLSRPGIAVDKLGRIGVVWEKTYDESGTPPDPAIIADSDFPESEIPATGSFVNGPRLQWLEADGSPYSSAVVKPELPENIVRSAKAVLSSDGTGSFLLISQAGLPVKTYGQRFQLTKPIELVDGQLRVNDVYSQFKDIALATTPIDGVRYVTFNDQVTDILASEVTSIDVTAGTDNNRIDLSRVSLDQFPSLVIDDVQGAITIRGGAGDDTIFGTALRDTIFGDDGNDEIFGGEEIDVIYGGEGDDSLQGGEGNDELYGEAGDDRLFGGKGHDKLFGGDGADRLFGNAGLDELHGDAGDDLLDGGRGLVAGEIPDPGDPTADKLFGGTDDDRYILTEASAASLEITDVDGIDEIDLSQTASTFDAALNLSLEGSSQPVFLDAGNGNTILVSLTIASGTTIENATGTRNDDQLTGNDVSNVLRGGLGDDVISGGEGADELLGEGGDDILDPGATPTNEVDLLVGGFGNDIYVLSDGVTTTARINDEAGTDKIDLSTWTGPEGATLDLSLTPEDGAYQIVLEENDSPKLRLVNSGLDAIEEIIGSDNDDILTGNNHDNLLAGGKGSDTLTGRGGDNVLLGQEGYDALEVADNVNDIEDASIVYSESSTTWLDATGGFHGAQRVGDNSSAATASWSFSELPRGDYDVYVTWSVLEGAPGSSAVYSIGSESITVNQAENPTGSVTGGAAWHRLENTQTYSGGRFTVDSSGDLTITLAHDASNGPSDLIYADAVRVVRRNQAPSVTLGTPTQGQLLGGGTIWEVDSLAEIEITVGDGDNDANLLELTNALTTVPGVSLSQVGSTAVWKLNYDGTTLDKTHAIILQVSDGTDTTTRTLYLRNTSSSNPISIDNIGGQSAGPFEYWINEANADVNDPLTTLSVTVNATVANGLSKKFSLGPGAPTGAGIDGAGILTWSPTEDQDGTHQIEVRVTDTGNPPLRVSQWITVHVAEINDAPKLETGDSLKLKLKHDTIGSSGTNDDGITSDATLEGWVRNDGAVDLIEIEVDYDYDPNTPTVFTADEVIQVEASDDDQNLGSYRILPDEFDIVLDTSNIVAVRAREWLGAAGSNSYQHSNIQYVTITPDPGAHNVPAFDSGSLKLSNDTGSIPNNTVDPTIEGIVTNDGSVEGLTVHFFKESGTNYPNNVGRPSYGSTKTDADGKFSFLPEGLLDGLTGTETSVDVDVWVVIEEQSPLTTSINGTVFSAENLNGDPNMEFVLHEQKAPSIASFGIKLGHDTGDNDTNKVTNDPWLTGSIDLSDPDYHGPAEGVIIEFYHDVTGDPTDEVIDGATVTDADGNFEYLPPGLEHGDLVSIRARAVAWDDYRQVKLVGDYYDDDLTNQGIIDHYTFTYDETENSPATILSLDLKYDRNADAIVVDPTIKGAIGNDGPEEAKTGLLVEFSIVPFDPLGTSADFDNPTGVAVTDENGEFEYTPFDLEANLQYDVYARVIEWDGLRGTHANNEALLIGDPSAPLSLTISSDAEPPAALTSYGLLYNTGGNNSDEKTADPTVAGTVEYDGDMQNVIVELSLGGTEESIVEVTPDELGNFRYTMPGLADDDFFDVQARVRVPDYTAKAPEFEDAWLNVDSEGLLSADGYLTGYTFDDPSTTEVDESGWSQDADGNGVPDITDAWLNDLFVGDGTELGGDWFNSDFTRDWENLFEDFTTEWTSLDRDPVAPDAQLYKLDLGDTAPFVIQLDAQSDFTDPTISGGLKRVGGAEIDNAQREGIVIEVSFDGGTEFEQAAVTDANGSFSYQLSKYVVGVNTVHLRFLRPQYGTDPALGSAVPATLVIQADSTLPEPTLELKYPRDEDGNSAALDAIDPTVFGDLGDATEVSLRRVQFEYSSDGTTWDNLPDGIILTDDDGKFEFTPESIESYLTAAGNSDRHFAIRARVVDKVTSETAEPYEYEVFGTWSNVVGFKSTVNQSPTIESFELAFDTGLNDEAYETLDRVTSDPTLVGRVVDSDNTGHANATVEFSLDGGTTTVGTTLTDRDGNFYYQPEGLTAGYHDIVVRVQEYDPVKGVAIDAGWQPLTATGDPSDTLGRFTGFTLIEPSPATVSHLEQVDLSNSGYDPTLTGYITDPDTVANVTIDFYRDPAGVNQFLGSTRVSRDGNFSFTPVGLGFGSHTIQAVPREFNYLTGKYLKGTGTQESLTLTEYSTPTGHNGTFGASSPVVDQADDFFTLTTTGTVTVPTDAADGYETVAPQYVEISIFQGSDLLHLGIAEIEFSAPTSSTSSVQYTYTHEYDLRQVNIASMGTVAVSVRPVGVDSQGFVFGADSNPTNYGYEVPLLKLENSASTTALLTGSDIVGNDGTLLRPIVAGNVNLAFSDTSYSSIHEVEIDYDGDGFADATVYLEEGEAGFKYELEGLEPGEVSLFARAITTLEKIDTAGGENIQRIEGAWLSIEFTLINPAPSVIPPTDPEPPANTPDPRLRLVNARDAEVGEVPVASDPTIVGTITTALLANPDAETPDSTTVPVAGMTVEIDHNSDGVADGTTSVDSEGRFEYTPTGLPVGNVTLHIRVIDYYSDTQPLVGDWLEFSFHLAETDPPAVSLLELERSEGTRDVSGVDLPISTNPVLTGTVDVPEGVGQVIVEFDHNNDDLADGRANVDLFGAFTYTPEGLAHGPKTIRARAVLVNGSERVIGLWSDELETDTSLTFYHASAEPAVITDLWIEDIDENGKSNSGNITGRVTVGGYGQAVKVAVYLGSSTVANGYTYADSNGFFRYQLQEITTGTHDIEVEGLLPDPSGVGDVPGENRAEITIDYLPGTIAIPALNEITFGLAYDTGSLAGFTADPTLSGHIPSTYLASQVYAEIKQVGTAESTAEKVPIRADGTFEYTPSELEPGNSYQYEVRIALWDAHDSAPSEDYLYSNNGVFSNPVSFTLDETDNAAAAITELNFRNGTTIGGGLGGASGLGTQKSAEPIFVGTVDNDGRKGGLIVEFDHNGDGVVDGTTLTREDGSFLYHAVGLEPGELTQTITAIVREKDYFNNERTSAIASLDFVLTRAPLVQELEYDVLGDEVAGLLHYPKDFIPGEYEAEDLIVQYELFGAAFDKPELATVWDPNEGGYYTSSAQETTVTDNAFSIDISTADYGTASVLVRGVDRSGGLYGPWQAIHFERHAASIAEIEIANLHFAHETPDPLAEFPEVSDPTIVGTLQVDPGAGGVAVPYGLAEIEVYESDGGTETLVSTHRVNADADGQIRFTPTLASFEQYTLKVRGIVFDPVTQQEDPNTEVEIIKLDFVPDNAAATVVELNSVHGTLNGSGAYETVDPTVSGSVDNNGRVAGLRVEFATSLNGEVIGATFTRPDGTFTFKPEGLPLGPVTLYARVAEWNSVDFEYVAPDFTQANVDSGAIEALQLDIQAASNEQPELDVDESRNEEYVHAALRDLLSFAITGIEVDQSATLEGSSSAADHLTLDLGFGEVLLLDGDAFAEDPAVPLFAYTTIFGLNTSASITLDTGTLLQAGTDGTVDYEIARTFAVVDANNDIYSSDLWFHLDFNDFEYEVSVPAEGDYEARTITVILDGSYTLDFSNATSDNAEVTLNGTSNFDGDYDELGEILDFGYRVEEELDSAPGESVHVATGVKEIVDELAPNGNGIITSGSFLHTVTTTETNRWEEQRNDTEVVTSDFGNQVTTTTTTTIEDISFWETITRTDEVNSSGVVLYISGETYDAGATVDSQVTVTTSYQTLYDGQGNSQQGSDTFTTGLLYTGTISVDTQYTGSTETSNFTLSENTYLTTTFSGSGSSQTSSGAGSAGSISSSETWHYGGSGFSQVSSQTGGTATTTGSGSNSTTTLDASGTSSSSFSQSVHGSGSVTFNSNGSADNTTSGSGSGSFLQTSSGGSQRSATLNAVDEVFTVIGTGSGQANASSSSTSSGTSTTKSTSQSNGTTTTTNATGTSRQTGGGSVSTRGNYDFTTKNDGQQVTGNFAIDVSLDGASGSTVTGTTTVSGEEGYTIPFNDSDAASYGLTVSHTGDYKVDTLAAEPIREASGTVTRSESFGTRATRFRAQGVTENPLEGYPGSGHSGGSGSSGSSHYWRLEDGLWKCYEDPGYSIPCTHAYDPTSPPTSGAIHPDSPGGNVQMWLSKSSSQSTRKEQYDYRADHEGTTRRGTFDNTDTSTNEEIDQLNYHSPDGNVSYFHRSDSGGRGTTTSDGPFAESPGNRTAEVNSTSEQEGFSGERSRYSNNWTNSDGNGGDTRGRETSHSSRKGQSASDGAGSTSIDNDEVTQNGSSGGFNGQGRASSGGTSFSETTTADSYSARFSTGDNKADAGGTGSSESAGGDNSNDTGSASAKTGSKSQGNGFSIDRSVETENGVTTRSSTISRGKNDGNSKGDSSGEITAGPDKFDVSSKQGGGNEGSTTQTIDRFGATLRAHSTYTSFGDTDGSRGFGGEVLQEDGRGPLRDGTVTEEGNGTRGGFGKDYHFSIDLISGSVSWERTVFDNENGGDNDSSTEIDDRSGDQTGTGSVGGNAEGDYTQTGGTFKLIAGGFTLSTYENTHDTTASRDTSGGFSFLGGVLLYTDPSVTESTEERTTNQKWFKQRTASNADGQWQNDTHHIDRTEIDTFAVIKSQTDDQEPSQTEVTGRYFYEVDAEKDYETASGGQQTEPIITTEFTTDERSDSQTYTLQGAQETLTINNFKETISGTKYENVAHDHTLDRRVLDAYGGVQQVGVFTPVLSEITTGTKTTSTSQYESRHTLGSQGQATGGQLSARSTTSYSYFVKGTDEYELVAPPFNPGISTKHGAESIDYQDIRAQEIREQGTYHDQPTSAGGFRRVGQGSYRQADVWLKIAPEERNYRWYYYENGSDDSHEQFDLFDSHVRVVAGNYGTADAGEWVVENVLRIREYYRNEYHNSSDERLTVEQYEQSEQSDGTGRKDGFRYAVVPGEAPTPADYEAELHLDYVVDDIRSSTPVGGAAASQAAQTASSQNIARASSASAESDSGNANFEPAVVESILKVVDPLVYEFYQRRKGSVTAANTTGWLSFLKFNTLASTNQWGDVILRLSDSYDNGQAVNEIRDQIRFGEFAGDFNTFAESRQGIDGAGKPTAELQQEAFRRGSQQAAILSKLYVEGAVSLAGGAGADLIVTLKDLSDGDRTAILGLFPIFGELGGLAGQADNIRLSADFGGTYASVAKIVPPASTVKGIKAAGKFDDTVASLAEARAAIQKAFPDAVELPRAVAGKPYPSPPPGVKKWYQIHPPEPGVGNNLPHLKYADWTTGKKGTGGSWGHIFFPE